jgi:tRNA (cmo5U34)-methyltransferase
MSKTGARRERVPEPVGMDGLDAATAFHRAGSEDGPLAAQYELCARGMSHLLGGGGSVLDLGSGSGRFLAYFAKRRPDAQLVGVELSGSMVSLGERMLAEEGLDDRVQLAQADMTACESVVPQRLDLLSCMLALHQLPSADVLDEALVQVARIRARTGCAVWIWDLVRLEDDQAMTDWMAQDPESDAVFRREALAGEAAAWTRAELADALGRAGLGDLRHGYSRPPLLQVHWTTARGPGHAEEEVRWREVAISSALRRRVMGLRLGFSGLR